MNTTQGDHSMTPSTTQTGSGVTETLPEHFATIHDDGYWNVNMKGPHGHNHVPAGWPSVKVYTEEQVRELLAKSRQKDAVAKPWGEVRADRYGELALFIPGTDVKLAVFAGVTRGELSVGDKLWATPAPGIKGAEQVTGEYAYHSARGDYEVHQIRGRQPNVAWPKFHTLSPMEQAYWVAKHFSTPQAHASISLAVAEPVEMTNERIVEIAAAVYCDLDREDDDFPVKFARAVLAASRTEGVESLQSRVQSWVMACFGPVISADAMERNHRFFEESTELVQACGMTASEAHQLVDYVFGRPVGEKLQEAGGAMVTLAALCLAQEIDMHEAGEIELCRVWTCIEKIRAKQAAKPANSPLPIAAPAGPVGVGPAEASDRT